MTSPSSRVRLALALAALARAVAVQVAVDAVLAASPVADEVPDGLNTTKGENDVDG